MNNKITDGFYLEYFYKKILQKVNKKNIFLTLSLQNWILSNEDKSYNYFHIIKIIKSFFKKNKKLKISFLHLDLDVYAPTYYVLDKLYNRVSNGGIILLDDYGKIHGATKATKDFFKNNQIKYKISSAIFDKKLKFIVKGKYL